ncbi:MAG: SMP-30/gluconolactonase/LRE family protein [Cytophagales bacterium]|nr:SMP-30/gluconolactonase/LRE family protein [Cytophagales bacterium]
MKKICYFMIALATWTCAAKKEKQQNAGTGSMKEFRPSLEILDASLEEIIDPGSKIEIIAEGFEWSEGPLWIEGLGLLFSDIPRNIIFLWTEEKGARPYLSPSGYTGQVRRGGEMGSNGLLLDPEGDLILCQHGDRRIAKMNASLSDPKADYRTIIDRYDEKKLNSPNDGTFNRTGDLYFTDPPYGLEENMSDPLKELPFQGVYKYAADGEITLLTDEMSRPNGIAFSPDEKTLYVANSDPEKAIWMEFKLNDHGLIESGSIFFNATSLVGKEAGLPDGLKVDRKGNIFATGPGGVWIFDPTGKVLGKIKTGQATSNCAFGNSGNVLYITADMYVMRISLKS